MSAGLPLPRKILAHGWWWTVDGEKMSKTLGNVVDPRVLSQRPVPASALRYFVMRDPAREDGDFSYDALLQRYNNELANDLGNLLNRSLAMVEKFCDGTARRWQDDASPDVRGEQLHQRALAVCAQVEGDGRASAAEGTGNDLFALVREGNTYWSKKRRLPQEDQRVARTRSSTTCWSFRLVSACLCRWRAERCTELLRQLGIGTAMLRDY